MQTANSDPTECVRDETLLAVLCLDLAEHFASRSDADGASRAHVDGVLLLIQHRRPNSFANPVSASLITGASSNVLLSALWSNGETETGDAVAILPDVDVSSQGAYAVLHQLLSRALRLEGKMLDHESPAMSIQPVCSLSKTLVTVQELDSDMDWWLQALPPEWLRLLDQPRSPSSLVAATHSDADSSLLEMTFILAQWHCTKLITLRLFYAAVISQCPRFPNTDIVCEELLERTKSAANSLCNLVAIIADTGPLAPSRAHRMERGLSGLVPVKPGQAVDWRGGAMDGKHCCLNILRWVLGIFIDEKDSVPGFQADRCALDYFTEAMRVVQNAFSS